MSKLDPSQKTVVWIIGILSGIIATSVSGGVAAMVNSDRHQAEQLAQIATDVSWIKGQLGDYYTKSHDDAVLSSLNAKNADQDKKIEEMQNRVTRLEQLHGR